MGNISVGVGAIVAPLKSVGVGGCVSENPVGYSVSVGVGDHVGFSDGVYVYPVTVGDRVGSRDGLCVGVGVGIISFRSMLIVGFGDGTAVGSAASIVVGSCEGLCVGWFVVSTSIDEVGSGVGLFFASAKMTNNDKNHNQRTAIVDP
jgi:hypothetical protein